MHELYELKEKLLKELTEYSENGKFSKEDAENIKNLSGAVDHICNIIEEDEYSSEYGGSFARGGNRGGGGRSNRMSNQRRNSRGRYSREGYSRDDARAEMVEDLREIMENAPEEMKRKLRQFISEIENS